MSLKELCKDPAGREELEESLERVDGAKDDEEDIVRERDKIEPRGYHGHFHVVGGSLSGPCSGRVNVWRDVRDGVVDAFWSP